MTNAHAPGEGQAGKTEPSGEGRGQALLFPLSGGEGL